MSMQWEILSKGVRKSPPEDVPKNFTFHVRCSIKSTVSSIVILFVELYLWFASILRPPVYVMDYPVDLDV